MFLKPSRILLFILSFISSSQIFSGYLHEIEYISIDRVIPGQLLYTRPNVDQKIQKLAKSGDVEFKRNNRAWFKHDRNRSPLKEALPGIKTPFDGKIMLLDGHHDFLAAHKLGALTIPIKIEKDLSYLSEKNFLKEAKKQNLICLDNIRGESLTTLPQSFDEMEDAPLVWFARLIARRCKSDTVSAVETTSLAQEDSHAYNFPVWVKDERKGVERPFIELAVAKTLHQNGLTYAYEPSNNPPAPLVEKAREILKSNPVEGLRLINKVTYYSQVNNGAIAALPVYHYDNQ